MTDEQFMRRALELAEQGRYSVSPNPMVGCVLVREGTVIGEGWHRRAGEAHAEVNALAGVPDPRGATMYVTLEPCSHRGRTGPCTAAILAAGISRVVVAMIDPHEVVNGAGIEHLRAVGVEVTLGILEAEARRLNETFIRGVMQKLPFVILKAAMTLDGKLATITRESQWITSEESRQRSLSLREEVDGIVVGSGTVRTDNPRLTRRLGLAGGITPWTRVVLDGDGDIPPHAQILTDGGNTLLYTSRPERYGTSSGLEVVHTAERADLALVFGELHARGLRSVVVEGGAAVHSDLIRRGLWQKMVLFVAPMVIGGSDALSILSGDPVSRLTDAYRLRFDRVEKVGEDLMIVAYPS